MKRIIIALLLTISVTSGFTQNLDANLLEEFNSDRNRSLDPTFKFITNSVSPLTIAAPVGFVTYALLKKDSASKHNAINVCTTVVINGVITTVMKDLTKRERPFLRYSFVQKETSGGSYSFPSGHTSSAFALATSISMAYPKWYVIAPSFVYASAVGYSRMDLGVHYPTDVLAGAIVGSGSAWLSYKLNKWINHQREVRRKL